MYFTSTTVSCTSTRPFYQQYFHVAHLNTRNHTNRNFERMREMFQVDIWSRLVCLLDRTQGFRLLARAGYQHNETQWMRSFLDNASGERRVWENCIFTCARKLHFFFTCANDQVCNFLLCVSWGSIGKGSVGVRDVEVWVWGVRVGRVRVGNLQGRSHDVKKQTRYMTHV